MNMFQHTPTETRKSIIEAIEVNLVPMVTSSPGLGKSAIVKQIAKDFNLKLIDLRLSQCAPEDLMGLPMRKEVDGRTMATFASFEMFPTRSTPVPNGYNGWILFLDEFNSATKMVQAAAYKLALDKMVGQEDLHENCFVVCAGNLATDRAIVNQMSTAMQSRLVHIEMIPDHKDFIKHAIQADFDHRIIGFLEFMPNKIHHFSPDHNDRTFACPRTWEFASRLIKNKSQEQINLKLLGGTISEGVAVEFHAFTKEYDKLPSYRSIVSDPENVKIPGESSTLYALVTMILSNLRDKVDEEEFKDLVKYVKRIPTEFQVIFFRGVAHLHPKLQRSKEFMGAIMHLTRFIKELEDTSGPISVAA